MIVFLTLIYVAFLFLAVKIGFIRMNSFWKVSPVLWMVLLFFVLFVPMQWGAPGGAVRVYQSVIEIVPSVSGEVVEVSVNPLVPVKAGDTLFAAGPPDVLDADDPYAAFEGRLGARLVGLSADDGEIIAEVGLDTPPVFDGLIAAQGCLFLALEDGSLSCLRPPAE